MKIAVTGANSAVGKAVLRHVAARTLAHLEVAAIVRSRRAEDELRLLAGRGVRITGVAYDDPTGLRDAFVDVSTVVHLVGVLVERVDSTYETANVSTTRDVIDAAKASDVDKVVFVSAIGASETSANRYWRTKGVAEALVRRSGLLHTVLRVPLLLGKETEGAAALRRRLSGCMALLIGGGRTLQQPLEVDDLARGVMAAADRGVAMNRTLDLAGPVSLTDREIVERAARLLGREVRTFSVPKGVVRLALALRERGGAPGLSRDALEVLTTDTSIDPAPAVAELGIELTGIEAMIEHSLEVTA